MAMTNREFVRFFRRHTVPRGNIAMNQHKVAMDIFTIDALKNDKVDNAKTLDEKVQDKLENQVNGGPEDVDNFIVEITEFRSKNGKVIGLYEFLKLLSSINKEFGSDIDNQFVFQAATDYFFQTTAKYFKIQFILFFTFCTLPFLVQVFNQDLDMDQKRLCVDVAMLTQILFIAGELVQLCVYGMDYLSWDNFIDVLMFVVWAYYYMQRVEDLKSHLPRLVQPLESSIDHQFQQSLLHASILILGSLKIMSFLRVFKEFGQLVKLMAKVISDMVVFTIFFFYWLFFASFMYDILGNNTNYDDYPGISVQTAKFLESFRNSLGDLATPKYDNYWGKFPDNNKAFLMVNLIWFTFFAM